MLAEIIALRLIHVLGGIFWLGSGLFSSFFLIPSLGAIGPAGGQVMAALQARRMFTVLPIVAVLTILSGLRLLWIASAAFDGSYFRSGAGHTFALGGAAAIISFLLSLLIVRPTAVRAGQLGASLSGMPDGEQRAKVTAQVSGLRRRMSVMSNVSTTLLILAGAAMAVARYVR